MKKESNITLIIFMFSIIIFPGCANAYDSYAEVLEIAGNKADALTNYKKSIRLNPNNKNAAGQIKKLASN
ncbi:hypothetical protein [Mucilaginibacter phyllosphaerae]